MCARAAAIASIITRRAGTVTIAGIPDRFASENINSILAAGRTQMTMRTTIIIEHGPENFSAYAPDFSGWSAAADTEKKLSR